ncbi:MAG TPA: Rieske 2Fe-2S domain-containing protein [Oscillatoriaceae cyanobacterium M33_DOE_052]|uniref:Pheophorbide a oxygenase n=1 Tax=Planktothricoides sp. SpSt-374 TaxID=2282167 RepID=A0A7C3VQG9_9CYAN|nr:Rieske 2Fe-2S domain-containing protein [Oscillatoriaceae cyanobacterium M33_DOE_052]
MNTEFNFFQQWYPVSPVEDLDPSKPTPITILGMRLVVWKPGNSDKFSIFLDECPHRLAPLSEGRIDEKTGNLSCAYHGWEFDPNGICTRIPQAENPEIVTKNQQNFCTLVFPVQEAKDLLWVWADPNSPELAQKTPLPLSPQIDASKGFVWSSYVRDLEYDWQTLVENVVDPGHVPFAHHGVQGAREKAVPLLIKIIESTPEIILAKIDRKMATTITFQPPCRLEYESVFGVEGKKGGLVVYCLPVLPGKSRIVAQFPQNFAKTLHKLTPRWWAHTTLRNLVIDGDMIFLHQQERTVQRKPNSATWKDIYKMPTEADRMVIEFRRWFDKYCHGKLPWEQVGITPELPPLNKNRASMLNRYEQHTRHCHSCRETLKWVERWQIILLAYFAITVATVAVLPDATRYSWFGLTFTATALLGLGVWAWLRFGLQPRFYFLDYVHQEKK